MLHIDDSFSITVAQDCGEVILTAAKDLQDYLFTSLGCFVPLRRAVISGSVPENSILVATAEQLGISFPGESIPAS